MTNSFTAASVNSNWLYWSRSLGQNVMLVLLQKKTTQYGDNSQILRKQVLVKKQYFIISERSNIIHEEMTCSTLPAIPATAVMVVKVPKVNSHHDTHRKQVSRFIPMFK